MVEVSLPDSPTSPFTLLGHNDACVVFLHGFTGNPFVWRTMAADVHTRTGAHVIVPRLPGHGTHWTHMLDTTWEDWLRVARESVIMATTSARHVTVVGLSMGGALALDIAAAIPQVGAAVLVNPALYVDSPLAPYTRFLAPFVSSVRAIGDDIAKPGVTEMAYTRTPVGAVAQLYRGLALVRPKLWAVDSPVTLCTSSTDHVVSPKSAALIEHAVPHVRRVILRHSFHVAPVDYDSHIIAEEICATLPVVNHDE